MEGGGSQPRANAGRREGQCRQRGAVPGAGGRAEASGADTAPGAGERWCRGGGWRREVGWRRLRRGRGGPAAPCAAPRRRRGQRVRPSPLAPSLPPRSWLSSGLPRGHPPAPPGPGAGDRAAGSQGRPSPPAAAAAAERQPESRGGRSKMAGRCRPPPPSESREPWGAGPGRAGWGGAEGGRGQRGRALHCARLPADVSLLQEDAQEEVDACEYGPGFTPAPASAPPCTQARTQPRAGRKRGARGADSRGGSARGGGRVRAGQGQGSTLAKQRARVSLSRLWYVSMSCIAPCLS